ncbi:MAG: ClC family H(+)/Cl(-) exchange transporter [Peptostreptococcaceae bacterium]|nr:ClC family H(+)/Cl(-) exchange transporter [Peptostreptococcaceae bacterium]
MSNNTKQALQNYMNLKKRVVLDGSLIGILAGLFTIFYRLMLSCFDQLRGRLFQNAGPARILLLILLFLGFSLIVALLIKWSPLSSGSGIPQIQGELLGSIDMDEKKVISAKFIGGGLCNLAGLSLGREGPSIQIGGACGKLLSRLLHKDSNEERFMISAGASAGLSAAFNAPISGTIFALEEMHKNFSPLILVPCLIASIVADYISKNIFGLDVSFHFIKLEESLPLKNYLHIIGIGIFSGLLGVCFNHMILKGQDFYKRLPLPVLLKPAIPFMISIVLGFTLYDVLGGGHHLVEHIIDSPMSLQILLTLLIAKLLFTSLSYGSSAQGGIFLPVLVLGALCGAVYVSFFEQIHLMDSVYLSNFVILGMAGFLTAVVRSPILSIMLVTEMVGSFSHMLSFCLVAVTAYLIAELLSCPPIYESLLERLLSKPLHSADRPSAEEKTITSFLIHMHAEICGKRLKDIVFPEKVLIVSVKRASAEFIPNGESVLQGGDEITVLCDKKNLLTVKDYFLHL